MKIRICTARTVSEESFVEVDSIDHLKELVKNGEIWEMATEPKEVSGEVLFNTFETEDETEIKMEAEDDEDGE